MRLARAGVMLGLRPNTWRARRDARLLAALGHLVDAPLDRDVQRLTRRHVEDRVRTIRSVADAIAGTRIHPAAGLTVQFGIGCGQRLVTRMARGFHLRDVGTESCFAWLQGHVSDSHGPGASE